MGWGDACYYNFYTCDTACGGGVPLPSGASPPRTYSYGPNCPGGRAGIDRSQYLGTNLGGRCAKGSGWRTGTFYQPGTAEVSTSTCCNMVVTQPEVCGDWYDCHWNQYNQPIPPMCRDCTPEVRECQGYNLQEYGCLSTCDDTAPTGLTVVDGPTIGTTATITWTPGANGASQKLYVDQSQTEVNTDCPTAGACEANSTLTTADTSELVSGLLPSTTYYFRVVTYSDASCSRDAVTTFTTPANVGIVSGFVYLDSTNTCDTTPFPGQTVQIDATSPGAVSDATGAFSLTGLISTTHTLGVTIPAGYICSTGASCNTCNKTGVISPSANNFFYLTQNRAAWWQARGAGVYSGSSAGGTVLGSTIPDSIAAGSRYLSNAAAGGTGGVVLRASGDSPSLGAGAVNAGGWSAKSTYKGKRADYAYFAKEMGLLTSSPSLLNLDNKPGTVADFHYINTASSINNPWAIDAGEKYIIFVNGDLTINANITVASGGFLSFIVKGNLTVTPSVSNIQGLYVMDNNFVTTSGASDTQLVVDGSVVAWGSLNLGRDLVANNSNSPAELFNYRADLLSSMPDKMKSFVMQWSEVVPGTYSGQ
ncbi:MAG: hypothetical protein WAV40_01485 [Microgenomates group bacterium]